MKSLSKKVAVEIAKATLEESGDDGISIAIGLEKNRETLKPAKERE